MYFSEEMNIKKKKVLEKLCKENYIKNNSKKADKELLDLFLEDTNNGKLYKYRSVTTYSIGDLLKGTLYCTKPKDFNDPFDSKIGVSIWSIYAEITGYETEKEWNILSLFFKRIVLYFNKRKHFNSFKKHEKPIIKVLSNNPIFVEIMKGIFNENDREEKIEILLNNKWILRQIVEQMLLNNKWRSELPFFNKHIEKIFPENNDCEQIVRKKMMYADVDELQWVAMSVMESNPDIIGKTEDLIEKIESANNSLNETLNKTFKIGCLSTDYKNRLMWSHYSNDHKGFCVEYDFNQGDCKPTEFLPLPVIYSKERPIMSWNSAIKKTKESEISDNEKLRLSILKKDYDWSYENEWRIIIDAGKDSNYKMPPISCIYLGTKISEADESLIRNIANLKGIPVKQMVEDRTTYDLHVKND